MQTASITFASECIQSNKNLNDPCADYINVVFIFGITLSNYQFLNQFLSTNHQHNQTTRLQNHKAFTISMKWRHCREAKSRPKEPQGSFAPHTVVIKVMFPLCNYHLKSFFIEQPQSKLMPNIFINCILPAIFLNSSAKLHIFTWQRIENHDNLTHAWDQRSITTLRWLEPNLAASKLPVCLSAITPTSHFLLLFFTFSEATQRKRGKHFHFRYTTEHMQAGQHANEHTGYFRAQH